MTREQRFPVGASVRLADLDVDPYPILARLREAEPVSWVPEIRMWFVTRRDDVVSVLRDAVRFTTDAPRSTIRDIFGEHMMTTDGEQALRYKRKCLHAFRADVLARETTPWVEERAHELVARVDRDAFDLGDAVAAPLAVDVALRVLGLPPDLSERVTGWYDDFARALANFRGDPAVRARGKAAAAAFDRSVRPLIDDGRAGSAGLLAHLAADPTDRLTDDEIVANALIILFGGIETTSSMITSTLWSLLSTGAWSRAVEEPESRPRMIEESMRWQPAVQSITRHTTEVVSLRGVEIEAGSVVQCMIGGANRDPEHFANPDAFDPDRANASDHLALGTGRHLCLGAHLARIEIRAVIDALAESFPELRFATDQLPELRGYEFRRPVRMVVQP